MSPRIRQVPLLLALLASGAAPAVSAQATWPPLPETTASLVEARGQDVLRRDALSDRRDLAERERVMSQRAIEALDAQSAVLTVKR